MLVCEIVTCALCYIKAPFKFTIKYAYIYFIVQFNSVCLFTGSKYNAKREKSKSNEQRAPHRNFPFDCSTFILILFGRLQFYHCFYACFEWHWQQWQQQQQLCGILRSVQYNKMQSCNWTLQLLPDSLQNFEYTHTRSRLCGWNNVITSGNSATQSQILLFKEHYIAYP